MNSASPSAATVVIASRRNIASGIRTADAHALDSLVESSVDLAVSTLPPELTRESRRIGSLAAAGIELTSLVGREISVPNTGVLRTLTHLLDVPFHVVSSGPIAQSLAALCIGTEAPRFGLQQAPLLAFWDREHYAKDHIRAVADELTAWLS